MCQVSQSVIPGRRSEAEANPESRSHAPLIGCLDSGFAAARRPGMTWQGCAEHVSSVRGAASLGFLYLHSAADKLKWSVDDAEGISLKNQFLHLMGGCAGYDVCFPYVSGLGN